MMSLSWDEWFPQEVFPQETFHQIDCEWNWMEGGR